ncbi:hypothetical protein KY289_027017 [Solanum tuberosum]|nr:hypothetical protein KY289_027017 [Solanum tuberosum]
MPRPAPTPLEDNPLPYSSASLESMLGEGGKVTAVEQKLSTPPGSAHGEGKKVTGQSKTVRSSREYARTGKEVECGRSKTF